MPISVWRPDPPGDGSPELSSPGEVNASPPAFGSPATGPPRKFTNSNAPNRVQYDTKNELRVHNFMRMKADPPIEPLTNINDSVLRLRANSSDSSDLAVLLAFVPNDGIWNLEPDVTHWARGATRNFPCRIRVDGGAQVGQSSASSNGTGAWSCIRRRNLVVRIAQTLQATASGVLDEIEWGPFASVSSGKEVWLNVYAADPVTHRAVGPQLAESDHVIGAGASPAVFTFSGDDKINIVNTQRYFIEIDYPLSEIDDGEVFFAALNDSAYGGGSLFVGDRGLLYDSAYVQEGNAPHVLNDNGNPTATLPRSSIPLVLPNWNVNPGIGNFYEIDITSHVQQTVNDPSYSTGDPMLVHLAVVATQSASALRQWTDAEIVTDHDGPPPPPPAAQYPGSGSIPIRGGIYL